MMKGRPSGRLVVGGVRRLRPVSTDLVRRGVQPRLPSSPATAPSSCSSTLRDTAQPLRVVLAQDLAQHRACALAQRVEDVLVLAHGFLPALVLAVARAAVAPDARTRPRRCATARGCAPRPPPAGGWPGSTRSRSSARRRGGPGPCPRASFSTSAISASVMNSQAGSAAMVSRPISTSMDAATSVTDSAVTTAPRFGSMVTRPSASRILKASRSGVREMPRAARSSAARKCAAPASGRRRRSARARGAREQGAFATVLAGGVHGERRSRIAFKAKDTRSRVRVLRS